MKVFAVTCVSLLALASCAWAAPSVQDNRIESDNSFGRAARYLGACLESDDMATCLAVKGITALNRAARSNNIELVNGVTFQRCVCVCESEHYAKCKRNNFEQKVKCAWEMRDLLLA